MMMWVVLIVLAATTAVATVILMVYRRQIGKICRQLEFLEGHRTNMRIAGALPFHELNRLTDDINQAIDKSRQVEREAQQNESQLKEAIANLSHDIRTPLTSMDGYFQLLLQAESEEEREHYLAVIRSRLASLTDMLEELFTYTKLQNESYQLKMEDTDLGKLLLDTIFSFYDEFQRKSIEPRLDLCEERIIVRGNPEAIRRTLQNVIKNCLEHGGREISMEFCVKDGQAVFRCSNSVEDAGEVDVDKVFDRFYKADPARRGASAGLGLAIAKGLVEKMGGTIGARMDGNVFTVEIGFEIKG